MMDTVFNNLDALFLHLDHLATLLASVTTLIIAWFAKKHLNSALDLLIKLAGEKGVAQGRALEKAENIERDKGKTP